MVVHNVGTLTMTVKEEVDSVDPGSEATDKTRHGPEGSQDEGSSDANATRNRP